MIIPVRCACGKVLADKYRYYQEEVIKLKLAQGIDPDKVVYLTKTQTSKTPEGIIMDKLGLHLMCCRKNMLTHVDID